jgi:hypothetical protein
MVFRTLMAFDWIGLHLIMLRKMFRDMFTVCLIITVFMAMFGFLYSMFSWEENIVEENPFLKPAMVLVSRCMITATLHNHRHLVTIAT